MLFGFFTLLFVLPSFSVTVELFWPEHHYLRVCTWGDLHSRHKPNRSWAPSIYSTGKVQFLVPAVTRPRKCPTTDRVESSRSYRILKLNAAKSIFGLQHFFHSKQPHGRVHRPHGWTLTKCELPNANGRSGLLAVVEIVRSKSSQMIGFFRQNSITMFSPSFSHAFCFISSAE